MTSESRVRDWVDELQSQGRYTFTRAQAEAETGRSHVAAQSALRRLRQQGRLASLRRGYYVIVPPEYRAAGSPPASWFIDDMMHRTRQPYYVGILTAAAFHGAAHQRAQVFQVVTSLPTRNVTAGRVMISFSMCRNVESMPAVERQTETGHMRVATPETAAFDLVRYVEAAGHLSNAATVLSELGERLDPDRLAAVAPLVQLPDVQRLGYLLDLVRPGTITEALHRWLRTRRPRATPLRPGGRTRAGLDARWHVLKNEDVEVDL